MRTVSWFAVLGLLSTLLALSCGTGGGGGSGGAGGAGGTGGSGGSGGTDGSVQCDLLLGTGCGAGQKCGALVDGPNTAITCVPDGHVQEGGSCAFGAEGSTTGHDDCASGLFCLNDRCEKPCGLSAPVCAQDHVCIPHPLPEGALYGICSPTCNPLTQVRDTDGVAGCGSADLTHPKFGCFGLPHGAFICDRNQYPDYRQGQVVEPLPTANSCAPGYEPLYKLDSITQDVTCVALCQPVPTSDRSPASPGGQAPHSCEDAGASGAECRYWWVLEGTDAPSQWSNKLGFCLDYTHYSYDLSMGDGPHPYPSCTALSDSANTFDPNQSDALFWGCEPLP